MGPISVQDRAHEFRITIEGHLSAEAARVGRDLWMAALAEALPRQIVVDISGLTGYDGWGRKWLREMHRHGTQFAASTPVSLVYLADITAPRRGPITVMQPPTPERPEPKPVQPRAIAASAH